MTLLLILETFHSCGPGDSPTECSNFGEITISYFNFSNTDERDDLDPEIWDSDSDSKAAANASASNSMKELNMLSATSFFFSNYVITRLTEV